MLPRFIRRGDSLLLLNIVLINVVSGKELMNYVSSIFTKFTYMMFSMRIPAVL